MQFRVPGTSVPYTYASELELGGHVLKQRMQPDVASKFFARCLRLKVGATAVCDGYRVQRHS